MWLLTETGFYSIVQKLGDNHLTVRARVKEDLDNLRTLVPELGETIENAGTDYPYRARVSKAALAAGMARMITGIGYDNFKEHVYAVQQSTALGRLQGLRRANVYAGVWSELRRLQVEREDR